MNLLSITHPCKLAAEQGRLIVSYQDDAGNECEEWLSLADFSLIVIETLQCSLTISALLLASKNNIAVVICDKAHQPSVFCYGLYDYYQLTTAIAGQIRWVGQGDKTRRLQQQIVARKLEHQADLLTHLDPSTTAGSQVILADYLEKIAQAERGENIERYEALFARYYFPKLFGGAFTRFANDYPNHLLNYAYAILRAKIKTRIIDAGLHPAIAIWHHNQFNNYNLADDIIEIFRPMADCLVWKILARTTETVLCKEDKHRCQLLILQTLDWQGRPTGFDLALKNYIAAIVRYFNDETAEVEIPRLNISCYDFHLAEDREGDW